MKTQLLETETIHVKTVTGECHVYTLTKITCQMCHGSGRGNGCIEQGGPIHGLCDGCCGYASYWSNLEDSPKTECHESSHGKR
jgi:hypothetical protein